MDPELDQALEGRGDVTQVHSVDLRVRADRDLRGPQSADGLHGSVEAPGERTKCVMRRAQPIHRDADALQPRFLRRPDPLLGQASATRGHRAGHAARAHGPDDVRPVFPQVGLTSDERHLPHAEVGHLIDQDRAPPLSTAGRGVHAQLATRSAGRRGRIAA